MRGKFSLVLLFLLMSARVALADAPRVKVVVLPFTVLADAGHEWIGRAIQEGVAGGIQKGIDGQAMIVPMLSPIDTAAAISAGKSASADFVILGSVQLLDDQMRISGQILSVSKGQSIGVLSSQGLVRDLFELEDVLSDRATRLLAPPAPKRTGTNAKPPTIELLGPAAPTPATYFDGNLRAELAPPDRFRAEYERYYYQQGTADWFCGFGYGYGLGYGGFSGCGPVRFSVPAIISGW